MQVERRDGGPERRTLLAAVTSDQFLARVVGKAGTDPFASRWANLVHQWCEAYYTKYAKAPGKDIQHLYEDWARTNKDPDVEKLMGRFLESLSDEHEKEKEDFNLDYAIQSAESHFNDVLLDRLGEEVRVCRERGDTTNALQRVASFPRVNLSIPPFVDLLKDAGARRRALEARQKVLIRYLGSAGEFFGTELSEDSFVGFMAPPKCGKSWVLLDLGWQAMRQGNKVAYFQVGDLTEDQILRRFQKRASYRPLQPRVVRFPTAMLPPVSKGELPRIDHEEINYTEALTWEEGDEAFSKIQQRCKGEIRLSYHPVKTVTVADISSVLQSWDRTGWKANVVIVDYAGNLAPSDRKANPIDQTAYTWAMLRQISEVRRCLVITANQTNKEGFRAYVLTRSNFADSKMILAHVTAFFGINGTDEEKSQGIIRYNPVAIRDADFVESQCLYCASCLDVGNPIVLSYFPQRSGSDDQ